MSPLDVLQMLGRAGRPGYDDRGYAWVVCDRSDADKYRRLLRDGKPIESRLAGDLPAHLNAEIALGTIESVADALSWLEETFYYVRASRAAESGGTGGGTGEYASGEELRRQVRETIDGLVGDGFVERADGGSADADALSTTALGRLASKFYLRLETAREFADLAERADGTGADGASADVDVQDVLRVIACAAEFDSVSARSDEEDAVAAVLGNAAEGLEPGERKVLAILTAGISGTTPGALKSDAWVIRQNARRLLAALRAIADRFAGPRAANLVSRVDARVDTGLSEDAVGLTAIDGVGASRARTLAAAGIETPADVVEAGPSRLEAAGLSESVGARVVDNAGDLPVVDVDWGTFPESIPRGENAMREVTVRSTAGSARAGIRVTVNGREMTTSASYLGEETVPVGVFGGDAAELTYTVSVAFPELPLAPVERSRTVSVVD